jgi:ribonuclease BN (tRNA processing enzyme)
MEIRILGAHNIETNNAGCSSVIIDDILAIDAGCLTTNLSIKQQQNLQAVLLTHQHYDHVRDIPLLGMSLYLLEKTIEIYTTKPVWEAISAHLLNDVIYPNLMKKPAEKPTLRFNLLESGKATSVAGYSVLPIKVNHAVPTVGYQITSPDGKKVFITSDTGPGLEDCWKQINPSLLLTETTVSNENESFALQSGHLTPALLLKELESFRKIKGYLPQIVLMHLNPLDEKEIKAEIRQVEKALNTKIHFGYEGMKINI